VTTPEYDFCTPKLSSSVNSGIRKRTRRTANWTPLPDTNLRSLEACIVGAGVVDRRRGSPCFTGAPPGGVLNQGARRSAGRSARAPSGRGPSTDRAVRCWWKGVRHPPVSTRHTARFESAGAVETGFFVELTIYLTTYAPKSRRPSHRESLRRTVCRRFLRSTSSQRNAYSSPSRRPVVVATPDWLVEATLSHHAEPPPHRAGSCG
jgi:hypothetical protein